MMKIALCRSDVSFSTAFNAARSAGAEQFYWGKKMNDLLSG